MDFNPVHIVAVSDQVMAVATFHELAELIACIDVAGHVAETIHRLHIPADATIEEILSMARVLAGSTETWGDDDGPTT